MTHSLSIKSRLHFRSGIRSRAKHSYAKLRKLCSEFDP